MNYFAIKRLARVRAGYGHIKLSRKWLSDRDFASLSYHERGVLVSLMLLACADNRLPGNTTKLGMLAGQNIQDKDLVALGHHLEWIPDNEEYLAKPKRLRIPDELRARIIVRDGGRCKKCGKTERLEVDHDEPLAVGGDPLAEENLQTLCFRCNRRKAAKTRRTL